MPRTRAENKPESRLAAAKDKATATADKKRALSPVGRPASKRARVEKPADENANAEAAEDAPAPAKAKPASKAPASRSAANGAAKKPASKAAAPIKTAAAAVKQAAKKPVAKTTSLESVDDAPPLNPLPSLPAAGRPAPLVWIWGASDSGQLGLGEDYMDEVPKPKRLPWAEEQIAEGSFGKEAGAGILTVTSGGLHSYLLDENGSVWSSGTNDEGALGRETKKEPAENEPHLKAQVFVKIQSLVDEDFKVVQLATGDNFGAALNDQGELKVWGTFRDDEGKSNFSSGTKKQMCPTSISIHGKTTAIKKQDRISAIAGGENHLVALTTKGEVYSWGIGGSGQLGRRVLSRHQKDALLPQRVVLGIRSRKAVLIGTGLRASFAVDQAGDVWAWGLNSVGQLGIGERGDAVSQPTKIEELSPANLPKGKNGEDDRVVQIRGGEFHTLFRTQLGRVFACGASNDYQLGLPEDHEAFDGKGTRGAECVTSPVEVDFGDAVEEDDKVVMISCGPRYNFALTQEGVLLSWGVGLQGELGTKKDTAITPEVVVRREGSWAATQVSCGGQHVMGLFKKRDS